MSAKIDWDSSLGAEAIERALMNAIRAELQTKIQEFIQPDIDAAVEAACRTFQARVATFREFHMDRVVAKLIINGREVS